MLVPPACGPLFQSSLPWSAATKTFQAVRHRCNSMARLIGSNSKAARAVLLTIGDSLRRSCHWHFKLGDSSEHNRALRCLPGMRFFFLNGELKEAQTLTIITHRQKASKCTLLQFQKSRRAVIGDRGIQVNGSGPVFFHVFFSQH